MTDGASVDLAGIDAAVVAEQVRLLIHKRVDLPINMLNASVVTAMLWPLYPVWLLLPWLGTFCAVILARFLIRRRYRMAAPGPDMARHWGRIFTLNAFATACLWGLTGSVILVTPDPIYHVFIVFVLGGMMAGGIVSNSAYMPTMLAFLFPTILPAIVALLVYREPTQLAMAMMLTIFTAVIFVTGRNINSSIVENFRLRLEQDFLMIKLRASDAAMAEAQAIAHVGTWAVDLQTETDVWSMETYRIFGVDPATVTPTYQEMLARVHPDDQLIVGEDFAHMIASGANQGLDHRIVLEDGTIKSVHQLGRVTYDANGRAVRMTGTVQDVSERKVAEEKLQFANILLKTQMEASPDGIIVVDASQRIISFNQRFIDIWHVSMADLVAGRDEAVLAQVMSSVNSPQTFLSRVQYLYDHPGEDSHDELEATDGRSIERYTVPLHTVNANYLGRAWFFRDITERKRSEAQALRMARYDVLTGLANRAVFVEALQHAIAQAKRTDTSFAILYLDLDHFKDVNDTLGHPVGDELLRAVADRLRANTREIDTIARFGGDEFAIIAMDIRNAAETAILAERLIQAFSSRFAVQGSEIASGASIGIATYDSDALDAETLLSHADVALYRAKSEGRGGYQFFTDEMATEVQQRVTLGAELRVAVDTGQLFLMYEPQIAIDSRRIAGLEALVRWRHPRRGVLAPGLFIPIAEQIGVIAKLGHWVLWETCRQGKAWLDAGIAPDRISVNVSALQFRTPIALEADIVAALAQTGLPPRMLELELTESMLMHASREDGDLLQRLRKTGVAVAIDDFGTGYSSLDYLRRFPSTRIKIAQKFVTNLETTPGDAAIVRATIGFARELGIQVTAEGVETEAQCDLLRGWGCGEVQGVHFSAPLDQENTTIALRDGNNGVGCASRASE